MTQEKQDVSEWDRLGMNEDLEGAMGQAVAKIAVRAGIKEVQGTTGSRGQARAGRRGFGRCALSRRRRGR